MDAHAEQGEEDHAEADGVDARSPVTANEVEPGDLGQPAIPIHDMRRQIAYQMRLPKMNESIRKLEKKVAELEGKLAAKNA